MPETEPVKPETEPAKSDGRKKSLGQKIQSGAQSKAQDQIQRGTEAVLRPAPLIAGLMGFSVIFATVGVEINKNSSAQANAGGAIIKKTVGAPVIIFGGVIGGSLLILVSHAGKPGRTLAVGLAGGTALASMIVYGAPVWSLLSKIFKVTGLAKPTGSTAPTVGHGPSSINNPTVPTATTGSSGSTGVTNPTQGSPITNSSLAGPTAPGYNG